MDKKSLVDHTEKSLLKILTSGDFKIGDALPKEIALAASLGVSRSVVREAMSRLRTRGLIDSRRKRGTILTQPDLTDLLAKEMNPELLDNTTLLEIMEMRLALEVGMADFIIKKATHQDLQALRSITAAETPKDKYSVLNTDFVVAEELNFHGKLYEIAGNDTVKRLLMVLIPIVNYILKNRLLEDPPPFKKIVTHNDLISLIEAGSAEKLRKGMRQHLNSHYKRLFLASQ